MSLLRKLASFFWAVSRSKKKSRGRHIIAVVNETVRVSAHTTWTAGHGNTGRTVAGDQNYVLAKEWASCSTKDELLAHPASRRFGEAVMRVGAFGGESPPLYRGLYPYWKQGEPTWDMLGPPPEPRLAGEGRYNKQGTVVLYLANEIHGIIAEIGDRFPDKPIYVQEFRLPPHLRIANFSSPDLDPFVNSVFQLAEECMVSARNGPENYAFSQTVAAMVKDSGFDGMLVPGVRGKRGEWYSNVVLFNPAGHWRSWAIRSVAPCRIR